MSPNRPRIVAHRGASKAARENTLEAFRLARQLGADMVELDVRRTLDDQLVVHHDPMVGELFIVDTVAAGLPSFIPTLDAALDACEGMEVNIEIKNDPVEPDYDASQSVAASVVALLRARGDGDRMLISSFNRATINAVRTIDPSLRTGFLVVLPEIPLSPFMASLAAEGHVAVHPHRRCVTAELCDAAHEHGLAVNVWTVDDPAEMVSLAGRGVDAIITNVPDVAAATVVTG
jgi:glycerophosphoryl diester phosphodiesterase